MILIVLVTFLLIMYQKCLEKIDSGQFWDLEGQERNVIYTIIIFPCSKVYKGN